MSKVVLVLGDTGRGKSASIENLDSKSTALINIVGKEIPYQGSHKDYVLRDVQKKTGNMWVSDKHDHICKVMNAIDSGDEFKRIIIDDFQYMMSYEFMDRAKEGGFNKFTEIAQHAFKVINTAKNLTSDIMVYILCHTETQMDQTGKNSVTKIKTIGKLLDEKITIEGLFSIVLFSDMIASKTENEYFFITQTDGSTTAKSPKGMFDLKMPNDLKLVEDKVRKYYS